MLLFICVLFPIIRLLAISGVNVQVFFSISVFRSFFRTTRSPLPLSSIHLEGRVQVCSWTMVKLGYDVTDGRPIVVCNNSYAGWNNSHMHPTSKPTFKMTTDSWLIKWWSSNGFWQLKQIWRLLRRLEVERPRHSEMILWYRGRGWTTATIC